MNVSTFIILTLLIICSAIILNVSTHEGD